MTTQRWTAEQANAWYDAQPWLVGCNFTPSTAINQLEMWQAGTFDPATIDRELGWAASLGMNSVRVYLHNLLWNERDGFLGRIASFLTLAGNHGIRPLFVLLDDCWNDNPALGPQPAPIPGTHNSGWVQAPGAAMHADPSTWGETEDYINGVIGAFKDDPRVLLWDLYNEPGNRGYGQTSLPLLERAFAAARAAHPSQPLSAGLWREGPEFDALNAYQLEQSDVITFHNYRALPELEAEIAALRVHGRPLICTEWMARKFDSRFQSHLPVFKRERVGCLNWGLVAGKTQTHFAWGEVLDTPEPPLWFHEIFYPDGRPYDAEEVAALRAATGVGAR